jgi:hypothetical protein
MNRPGGGLEVRCTMPRVPEKRPEPG